MNINKGNNYSFSTSKFNLLLDCYGKYYYKYIEPLDIKDIVWPATIFGLALHKTVQDSLEEYNKGISFKKIMKEFHKGLFKKTFENELSEAKKTKDFRKSKDYDKEKFIDYGDKWSYNTLDFINKRIIQKGGKSISSEQKYSFEVKDIGLKINGVIDFHYEDADGLLHVLDFKTTKDSAKFYFVEWKKDIQSLIYFYLLNKNNIDKIKSFSYMILNKDEKMLFLNSINYELHKEVFNIQKIETYFNNIFIKYLHILNNEIQDTSKWSPEENKCRWCNFSEKCPVAIK